MIKRILPVVAIASMMLATSCSNDELNNLKNGENSTVTLNAQLADGLQTRAFGDGTTAKTLDYAVYEVKEGNWTLLDKLGATDQEINMSKTISLNLVNGKTYAVVFWADAAKSIYTFDATAKKVTADYTNATCSNEAYDAFYAVEEFKVDGENLNRTVSLKRPFAQLNIGTSDLDAAAKSGVDVSKTAVTVKTYNTLNFDGTVDGEKEVTFEAADKPTEAFPVEAADCKYLAMNYLLMPADKETEAVKITYTGTNVPDARTFENIPLQRSYRTNIFGALLTSTNTFNVTITPAFEEPAYNANVWDGSTKEVKETDGVYEIYQASELAWIAQKTLTGEHFAGKTIKLMGDLDLNNIAWTPIGGDEIQNGNYTVPNWFGGTLDGNGKTIYNLNVTSKSNPDIAAAGLIGGAHNITVKDLNLKHVKVQSNHNAGAIVGAIVNNNFSYIQNCTVDDATITSTAALKGDGLDATVAKNYDNGDKVGGIVGSAQGAQIIGNTVTDTTVTGYRDLGGIAGQVNPQNNLTSIVKQNKIENVTIVVDNTYNYKAYTSNDSYNVQSIVGRYDNKTYVQVSDNNGTAKMVLPF